MQPITPPGGSPPIIPLGPPPPSELTEEQQDTLEIINDALKAGLPDDERISINAFFDSVIDTLVALIQELRTADLQGDSNVLLSQADSSLAILQALLNRREIIENQSTQMDDLVDAANDLNDQKDVIDSTRDDYNDAVQDYLDALETNNPILIAAAEDNLIDARDALNQAINDYNNLVAVYLGVINTINQERASIGADPIEQTNALPIVEPIPASELIDFEPGVTPPVLVPPIGLDPPMAVFDPDFTAFEVGMEIDDDYEQAFNDFINIRNQLNVLIAEINADGNPINPANVAEYNALVSQYNSALGVLNNERNQLNAIVPPGSELPDPLISPESTINPATPTPLPAIVANPPDSDWALFFEQARDNYNQELSDYFDARDALNDIIDDINDAFNTPGFDFTTEYPALRDQYNAAIVAYNAALANLLTARDTWNDFINTHANGAFNIIFDADSEDPLPNDPEDIPPPLSDVSVLEIDIDGNEFFINETDIVGPGLDEAIEMIGETGLETQDLVDLAFADRNLLSLIFLARGSIGSELYEPTATAAGSAGTSTSAQGGSLASVVLGLSSPRIATALSEVNIAEAFDSLFASVDASPPAAITSLFQNVTTNGGINAALASTRFALKIVADFLKILTPESFPTNLAAALGLSQALAAISNNGGFSDIVRSSLSGIDAIAGLPNDNREALFETVGGLAAFSLIFAAAADLGNVVDNAPELALGTLALNLSFGVSGTQLGLREAVKSLKNVPGGVEAPQSGQEPQTPQQTGQTPSGLQDLTNAFTDILSSGGIAGDDAKALALRVSTDLLTVDDPNSVLRLVDPRELRGQIANLTVFASLTAGQSPFEGLFGVAGGQSAADAIQNRFKRRGLSEDLANQFVTIARQPQSTLRKVAQLQAAVGPEGVITGFNALRDVQIASSLNQKLKGELSSSEGQSLIKEALTSVNSLSNTQDRIIKDFVNQDNRKAIDKATELAKELFKGQEKPHLLLSQLQEPTKAMLHAASSIMGQGMLPEVINGRTDAGQSRDVDIHV